MANADVTANRTMTVASIVARDKTSPNLRMSLTSQAAQTDARHVKATVNEYVKLVSN